jgi:hypothetical protein
MVVGFAVALALSGIGCGGKSLVQGSPVDAADAASAVDAGDDGVCHDLFRVLPDGSSPVAPCCPDQAPDCTMEPQGYPPGGCIDRRNQFCLCMCYAGTGWSCGC